jgi:hypothetical protein
VQVGIPLVHVPERNRLDAKDLPTRQGHALDSWLVGVELLPTRGALVTTFVVLRCPLDRQEPALAPHYPDLGFRLQFERRSIQASEPNLDERVTGINWIEQTRAAESAKATSVIA